MQICEKCQVQSPDDVLECSSCGADLREYSTSAQALKRMCQNPRVKAIRLAVPADACPVCQSFQGTYSKEETPDLPIRGCSCPQGSRVFYEPVLEEIYP
jgi:hypothetical protein